MRIAVHLPSILRAVFAGACSLMCIACVPSTMRSGVRTTPLENLGTVPGAGESNTGTQSKTFGRSQDLSFQRSRFSISQRSHMRLWLAPYTVEGRPVWAGQVSRDIGIKLTTKSPTFTTHVIDLMVDEARQFVLESLLYRFRIRHFGFVRASPPAPPESPRHNLTGDPYLTDGMRLIVFLASGPVSAGEVRDLGWEKTGKGPIEFGQSGDSGR